jgi:hypothetical protein
MKRLKFLRSKRGLVLLLLVISAAVASVAAYAYYASTGDGSGSKQVTLANPATQNFPGSLSVDIQGLSGELSPGGTLSGTFSPVNNHGTASIAVHQVAFSSLTGLPPGCDSSWFTTLLDGAPSPFVYGPGTVLGPGVAGTPRALSLSMTDAAVDQSSCKGATPTLVLSIS